MKLEPIDTNTTAGKARVMQLAVEGRKVVDNAGGEWTPIKHPCWNWEDYGYAIIAQPVGPDEVWVIVAEGHMAAGPFKDEESAVDCASSFSRPSTVVRYRRVEE